MPDAFVLCYNDGVLVGMISMQGRLPFVLPIGRPTFNVEESRVTCLTNVSLKELYS